LGLDLTIDLCHRTTDTKILCEVACTVALVKFAKSVANWKELSSFILGIFWNFSATKAN